MCYLAPDRTGVIIWTSTRLVLIMKSAPATLIFSFPLIWRSLHFLDSLGFVGTFVRIFLSGVFISVRIAYVGLSFVQLTHWLFS